MIRVGILGDISSGKSYVANNFGYPVFNADYEVLKLYEKDKKIFKKLKKRLPNYISSFPINKNEITKAILSNKVNLKKIITVVHLEIRKALNLFLKKNKNKEVVILDIPLLLENKINKKNDILVYVDSKKLDIEKRLKKRQNFNRKLFNKFKKIQFNLDYKKKKSHYIIRHNFTKKPVKEGIKKIINEIL